MDLGAPELFIMFLIVLAVIGWLLWQVKTR
jgi:hypothetical protein